MAEDDVAAVPALAVPVCKKNRSAGVLRKAGAGYATRGTLPLFRHARTSTVELLGRAFGSVCS